MARKRLSVASLIPRRVYNNCGVVESVGECWKNERGGCELVSLCNEMVGISAMFSSLV